MKKRGYLLMPVMMASLLVSCGGNAPTPTEEYSVYCSTEGVNLSNSKAIKGQDYNSELILTDARLTQGYMLPTTLSKVTSGKREITANEYTYTLKDDNKKADLKIPSSCIEGEITINLSLVFNKYILTFKSATCEMKDNQGNSIKTISLDKGVSVNYQIFAATGHQLPLENEITFKVGSTDEDFKGEHSYDPSTGKISLTMTSNVTIAVLDQEYFQIHYHRNDNQYDEWGLWLWEYPSGSGADYAFNGIDDYGVYASYPLNTIANLATTKELGFIVKKADWTKDPDGSPDRVVKFKQIKTDDNLTYHIYLESGDNKIYVNKNHQLMDEIDCAKFSKIDQILIRTKTEFSKVILYQDGEQYRDYTPGIPGTEITFGFRDDEKPYTSSFKVEVTFTSGVVITQPVEMSLDNMM